MQSLQKPYAKGLGQWGNDEDDDEDEDEDGDEILRSNDKDYFNF